MAEVNTVRIIWLSDIHFRKDYNVNATLSNDPKKKFIDRLDHYLRGFLEVVRGYHEKVQSQGEYIDYVLISGDLAFSSSKEDYDLLEKLLVKPLKDALDNKTKFLTIPGNHDVLRGTADFLRHFLYDADIETTGDLKLEIRKKFLEKKVEYFNLLFNNYTSYFLKHIKPTLSSLPKRSISKAYEETGLYGLVIDKDKNVIFNLINSSWFALGTHFDKILIEEFMHDNFALVRNIFLEGGEEAIMRARFEKIIKRLVGIKDALQEYGQQILGETIMPVGETLDTLNEHSGSFVITCFHHPTNWLQYTSKYNMDVEKNNNLFLNRVLDKSEMLLTGHEHVPSSVSHEKIQKEIFHLKGGMFLQDNACKEVEGEHRFSILEIDTSRFLFNEKKYSYDWDKAKWDIKKGYSIFNQQIRKKYLKFRLDKEEAWKKKMRDKSTIKNILLHAFMSPKEWDNGELVEIELANVNFKLFALERNAIKTKFFVVPLDNSFFNTTLLNCLTGVEHCFDIVVKKMVGDALPLALTIITPDFLVDEDLRNQYLEPDTYPIKETFSAIVNKADFICAKARHDFFIRFENYHVDDKNRKKLIINGIDFSIIRELRFSHQVIPFWTLERYD